MEAKTPGIATPRKPVLSVSARKIKDNAADWHNLILKWESLNDAGFTTASNIANLKVSLLFGFACTSHPAPPRCPRGRSKEKVGLESSSPASSEKGEKRNLDYDKELEALCEELQVTLDGLTKIQMKMEKLSSTTKGICELENYHYKEESNRPLLFHTWPTTFFYEVSHRLSSAYKKELLLKHTIGAELAHTADRDLILTYLSMWLHQPYIESDSKLQLESMLLETGHRAL
ncbi:cyclin-dependent kinase 2-interacting protein isoform X1 [Chionomys nivalis]|uniref:cyclin-dependent kinase 2-interacting protein isoform X1 n=1 Tax=Chionomys nivalis TaxID=269649 RepID=UPI0025951FF6|nr:cyclin-dependent kinase 2-interacting protein isoform X1 [Chionomys nivalis]